MIVNSLPNANPDDHASHDADAFFYNGTPKCQTCYRARGTVVFGGMDAAIENAGGMVAVLEAVGLKVIVLDDDQDESTPNAIDLEPMRKRRAEERGADPDFCLLCGRPLDRRTARLVHCVDGGFVAIPYAQEYSNEAADMGAWSIGPDCARLLPPAYTVPAGTGYPQKAAAR